MAIPGGTIPGMAKRGKPGRPKGRKPAYVIYVRVDPAIGAALDAYIDQTEPRPSQTAAVELALKRLLTQAGFYPPKPPPDEPAS